MAWGKRWILTFPKRYLSVNEYNEHNCNWNTALRFPIPSYYSLHPNLLQLILKNEYKYTEMFKYKFPKREKKKGMAKRQRIRKKKDPKLKERIKNSALLPFRTAVKLDSIACNSHCWEEV